MIKTYCDKCEKEITTMECGVFSFIEKEKVQVFVKHQPHEQEGLREKKFILCIDCSNEVRKLLNL